MAKEPLLIRSGIMITDPSTDPGVSVDKAVYVENGRIGAIGPFAELSRSRGHARVIGDEESIVLPGLINAHDHGRGLSPLSLGIADDLLEIWILSLLRMPALDIRRDTALSALRQARSGVSTTVNSYYDPRNDASALRAAIDGYADAGVRAGIVYSAMDDSIVARLLRRAATMLPASQVALVDGFLAGRRPFETGRFLAVLEENADLAVRGLNWLMTGPVSAHWSSDDLLGTIRDAARRLDLAMQMHLLESPFQALDNRKYAPESLVRHLDRLGLLDARMSCAHCVQTTEDDIRVVAARGASVVHNISSNLRLRNGRAPVAAMLDAGVNVALGLDSAGLNDDADMFQEMRLAYRVHGDLTTRQVVTMATINGARALGRAAEIGTIAVGKRADILVLDGRRMEAPGLNGPRGIFDRLVNYGRPEAVRHLIVDGEPVIADGLHATLREESLVAALNGMAAERMVEGGAVDEMIAAVTPVLRGLLAAPPDGGSAPNSG